MSKTIKIIDLLNKMYNKDELPKKIKYDGQVYELINGKYTRYSYGKPMYFIGELNYNGSNLKDTVEIIEDEQEIDIQNIKELDEKLEFNDLKPLYGINEETMWTEIIKQHNKLNELVQAVKYLDNKLKEK